MNLPNKLTLLRVLLIPVFILCFYIPVRGANLFAAAIFLLAYLTDIFDGLLARKYNIITDFGKLMDPIADKLLSCSAFIMLVSQGMLSPIAVIIIIAREFIISGFRLVSAGRGNIIAASWLGKTKTISQCAAVLLLLVWSELGFVKFPLDKVVLWVSVVFTIISGADYIVKNYSQIDLT